MKILIYYFSGTGNTKRVVDFFYNEFVSYNNEVTLVNIEKEYIDPSNFDLVCFAHPIYAFNAPRNVVKFIKKLPKQIKKKEVLIIKTSGEPLKLNNNSSNKIRKMLKRRNLIIKYEYHYVMPYNIIFRHTDYEACKMIDVASKLIKLDVKDIFNSKEHILKATPFGHLISGLFRIEYIGDRINGWFYHTNHKKCIMCKKCINDCPNNNIYIKNGRVKFHSNCLMCQRCSMNCPKDAIKIGLFNSWKVNGGYTFNECNKPTKRHHKHYCKRAYQKYFDNADKRINIIRG